MIPSDKRLAWIIVFVVAVVAVFLIRQSGESEHSVATGDGDSIAELPDDKSSPNPHVVDKSVETNGYAGSRRIIQEVTLGVMAFTDVPEVEIDRMAVDQLVSTLPAGDYRIVSTNSDALRAIIRNANAEPAFDVLLLGPEPVTLVTREAEEYTSGWQSGHAGWAGAIQGQEFSSATFVIDPNGVLIGGVDSPETGSISIERIPDTNHYIMWALAPDFAQPHED